MNETNKHYANTSKSNFSTVFQKYFTDILSTIKQIDRTIVITVFILIVIGLIFVYSATMFSFAGPFAEIKSQLQGVVLGLILSMIIFAMPYQLLSDSRVILLANGAVIFLLILTLMIGKVSNGAKSWLEIAGISLQASELFKFTSVWLVAFLLEYTNRENILSMANHSLKTASTAFIMLILGFILILLQPDYGMLIIIFFTLFHMYIFIRGQMYQVVVSFIVALLGYGGLWLLGTIKYDEYISGNHFTQRIAIFTNPFQDATNSGYQLIQSFKAFSRGGLTGLGIGNGIAKTGLLPEIHTDFILTNIAEETGFIGVGILLIIFMVLIVKLYLHAARLRNIFRRSVILGIAGLLLFQMFVNIGGIVGIIPLTGVTLPFISSGGTSMMVSIVLVAFALRMIAEEDKKPQLRIV